MELEWTGWDLNPGLPACKAGDLPLIYRPRRAHSVATQMKLSARIRALSRLNAYPLLGDEGAMGRVAERALRWFVGRSEERRVGKECRSRWAPCQENKKTKIM